LFHTLYARLGTALLALLVAVGTLYALVTVFTTQRYMQELTQHFNRDLAKRIVDDRNLVAAGRLDRQALKETFRAYMVINPSIEIYLLDLEGRILSFSADPGKVKRQRVDLGPIRAFMTGEGFPLLGDDPRSHDRRKAFSVTPVPSSTAPEGYLYVVLRGEEYDSAVQAVQESYVLRLSAWALAGSLGFALLAGLMLFFLLTRRLRRLSTAIQVFQQSDFSERPDKSLNNRVGSDEIGELYSTFQAMADRIIDQLELLRGQDQKRRELVAQISHDLRTPLAVLHGYLETLEKQQGGDTQEVAREFLGTALHQSQRLKRMVEDLFELAQLEARDSPLQTEPVSFAELAQDVVQKFQPLAAQKGVLLNMPPPTEACLIDADIAFMERLLDNLIDNALAHTPKGGTVDLVLAITPDDRVCVQAMDTGEGFEEAELPRLFESFFRGDSQLSNKQHAGLGLAIAQRIVQLHGGEIRAENRPEGGALIQFLLPKSPIVPAEKF
jgi:two-component system OmpR family sensor kinase